MTGGVTVDARAVFIGLNLAEEARVVGVGWSGLLGEKREWGE